MDESKVKLIIGSHGSGKSDWIFNHFLLNSRKNDKTIDLTKKFYLVVPEQDTNDKQRQIMKKAKAMGFGAGIINIDIVSFDRIAHNVFDILNIEPEKEKVIQDDAKTMILSLVLSRLNREGKIVYFKKMINRMGFAKKLTQVVSEFYSYNVKKEDIDKVISKSTNDNFKTKLADLKLIYEEFIKELNDKDFSIKEDKYNLLNDNIEKVNIFNDAVVAFDGFTGFTPVQLEIFKKIVKASKETYVSIDIRDTEMLYGKNKSLTDVFYLSEKFADDIAKALTDIKMELPYENYINMGEYKNKDRDDLVYLEKELYNYKNVSKDKMPSKNIKVYSAKNVREEVQNICQIITEKVRNEGLKFNDIKIIVPDVIDYSDIMIKESSNYNIPLFIDDSTGVYNSPYIESIRAAIDVLAYDFSYDSVMRYLNAGFEEKNEEINKIDNYIRKYGIRGHKAYEKLDFEHKKYFEPLLKLYYSVFADKKVKQSITNYVKAIKEFIVDIELDNKFDDFITKIDKDSYDYARQMLILKDSVELTKKTIANLELINEGNSETYEIDDFRKALDVGFESIEVKSIPFSLDQVVVGDFMRSRFDNPKVVIVAGLNQSRIPGKTLDLSLIDDSMRLAFEKEKITLSQTTFETALNQRFYTYLALTNEREELILSYSMQNVEGASDEKSSIVVEVEKLFDINEIRIDAEDFKFYTRHQMIDYIAANKYTTKNYYYEKDRAKKEKRDLSIDPITKEKALKTTELINFLKNDEKYKEKLKRILTQNDYIESKDLNEELSDKLINYNDDKFIASPTAIESFNECPYRYFLEKTVRLKERESFEIDPRDLGSFYHSVLDHIFKDKNFDIRTATDFDKIIDDAIEKSLQYNYKFDLYNNDSELYGANKLKYVKDRAKATLITSLKVLKTISLGSKLDEFNTEKSFAYDIDDKSSINGRIDSIERLSIEDKTYINIIDYKSGKKQVKIDDIEAGVDIQLILYLDYCLSEKFEKKDVVVVPCGAFYFTLQNPIIKIYDLDDIKTIDSKVNEQMSYVGIGSDNADDIKMINDKLTALEKKGVVVSYASTDNGITLTGEFMDEEKLTEERNKVKDKIIESIASIKKGIISKKPYDEKKNCAKCSFKNICRKEFSLDKEEDETE